MELQRYFADDKVSTLRFFENAVPIVKAATLSIQNKPLPCACIKAFNLFNKSRNFNAVSTNILDRGSTNRPGYERQIFKSIQAFADTARDQGVPVLPCSRPNYT